MSKAAERARHLVLVLGDPLDARSAAFDGFDGAADVVWMAEADEEANTVWSTKARIAIFLAAMRHLRDSLRRKGLAVDYHALGQQQGATSFAPELARAVKRLKPRRLVVVEPGEWRVKESLKATAKKLGLEIDIREDRHFHGTHDDFEQHAAGRKELRNEYFYREMRHQRLLRRDRRMGLQVKNIDRLDRAERRAIRRQADALRSHLLAEKGRY